MATNAIRASLLEAVRGIAPILLENAAGSERERHLSDQAVEAMKRAGLFRMCKPRAFGGMEVDPTTAIQVYEEVSRFDMSAGWNLFLSSSGITFADWISNEGVEDSFSETTRTVSSREP